MSRIKTSLDHKRIRRLIWLVLTVSVLLGYSLQSVAGTAYYSNEMQTYTTVSSPPVILQNGTAGTSTIYANGTSAKVSVAAPVWLGGWDERVKITIDSNDVDSALSNFPVLVYLSSSSGRNNDDVTFVFDEVGSNSKKIAITTSDGTTECYVEIEKWNATSEQAWLWVKVPSVSNTSNTDLYLYYDNSHADNTAYVDDTSTGNSVNVWDSSFKMVQHMRDDTTSSIVDSTSNDNDGTKTGAGEPAVTTSGKISDAQDFDGSNDYIETVSSSSEMGVDSSNTMTVSAWVNPDVNGDHQMFVIIQPSTGSGHATDQVFYIADNNGDLEIGQWGGGSYDHTFSGISVDIGVWQHFVITYDGSTYRAYKNGNYEDSWTRAKNLNNTYVAFIGSSTAYAVHYFEGIIDEVRISNVSRTAAWIKASYENGRDNLIDFRPEEYVDNNTSNVDSSSPADKGTHSNFTAQQYGPDLINDTLTEENTGGGATGITPITAFQDTEQHITSSSLQSLNCETSALANGVTYLVIYCGNHGGGTTSEKTEMVLEFGTTIIARGIGEGRGLGNHWDTGQTSGFYIVTGDGINTLRFRGRNLAALDDGYFGAMAIIAIPLTNLTENQDYWQSVQNGDAFVVTNAAVGSWTTLLSQTFNLPETGNYLVLMSAEGQPGADANTQAAMVRFRADGATLGPEYHQEWENNDDIMSFMKAQVVSLSSGNRIFAVECQSRTSATSDFRRGRIVIIKASVFDQIVQTTDTTGDTTTSTTPVDFSGLDTVYTPNQQEYVVVLANVVMGSSTTDSCVGELYDGTSSYRVDSGEYENDNVFDSGRDQQPTLMAHTKQISSETTWKLRYRAVAGTGAIGKNPANTAGIQSDLIVWSLTISGAGDYELDLEVQWTGVDYDETNEYLGIYCGNMASENLQVDVRNGSQWTTIITKLNATTWNNVSVSSYLTSSTFTIRFLGTNETNDVTQSSWNIDATLLHIWTGGSTWLSGWDKRVKITIDHNDIDSSLPNFPVLVYLSNSSGRNNDDVTFVFDEVGSNSKKIAVTESDGTTQCYVEIEKWDNASEQAWLWVKVPSISSTANTDLYLYYDSSQPDNTAYVGDKGSTAAQNVWNINFKGVWHLDEDPSGTSPQMKGSTSNNHNGTSNGNMTSGDQIAGKIDGSLNFDRTDDYINTTSNELKTLNNFTLSVWFKADSTTTPAHHILWEGPASENGWGDGISPISHEMHLTICKFDANNTLNFFYGYEESGWAPAVEINISFSDTTNWNHAVVVMTGAGTSPSAELFLNGVSQGTDTGTQTNRTAWDTNLRIGRPGLDQRYFDGMIDEVRILETARSAGWIKASYESGRDDLLDFGAGTSESTSEGTYDYVLKINNTGTDSWEIRLKKYADSNISRLQNCTIYFHNSTDGTSNQIIIENGSYANQTGPWYDLGDLETIYIAMTVQANSAATSYVYTYLEILTPNTTTYAQYVITFEIT